MRRRAALLLLVLTTIAAGPSTGREPPRRAGPVAIARPSGPPHAWLFGAWTGGLFPVLDGMAEQDCRTQPTLVFTQDYVGHASLLAAGLQRRVIETVRTSPAGAEFRFSPEAADPAAFGCENPNVLHVARETDSTVTFPHCAAFPYPLHRCPAPAR